MKNLALLLMISISVSGFAQERRGRRHASSEKNVHAFMEVFTNLERDWTTAIQKHDASALDKLLAPEFIVRNSVDPEHVMNRSEWLEKIVPTSKIESFSQSDLAVRVFPGDIALVSFVQSNKATVKNSDENGRFLIVDVWVANPSQNQWQAAQRYWAPIARRSSH
jgi:hypothetical protein